MMQYKAVFEFFQKITSASLCKQTHDIIIIPLTLVLLNMENVVREGKKLQKFEYLEKEKSFVDGIKSIFHSFFERLSFDKKIKK